MLYEVLGTLRPCDRGTENNNIDRVAGGLHCGMGTVACWSFSATAPARRDDRPDLPLPPVTEVCSLSTRAGLFVLGQQHTASQVLRRLPRVLG